MINSRRIEDLVPEVGLKARELIAACAAVGVDIIITSTYRDIESQRVLWEQGRISPGNIVTNAKGGYSYHNFRVAFDVVPVVCGKAIWTDLDIWRKIGKLGEEFGLEWAGRWKRFPEYAHFQLTGGRTLEDFRNGVGYGR
jgi:peptidoglycan L-alanyl-D-glutamate endopeptidase CwlK